MKALCKATKALLLFFSLTAGEQAIAQDLHLENKQLLANFGAEVFGKKDLSNLKQFMHDDYIHHNPLVPQGLTGFKQFFTDWFIAVPDWNYSLSKIVAEGDMVWVYGTYAGTQKADWLGIPASNKHYSISAVDIFRIQDGKLAEHWDVIDVYGLFKQLGVIQ